MDKNGFPTYLVEAGAKVGRWSVIVEAPQRDSARYWLCRCECGTEREVYESGLRTGASLSCGCLKSDRARENAIRKTEVRAGTTWGKWTVLSDSPSRRYYRMCRCECGTEREVVLSALLSGRSQSCGCASGKKRRTTRPPFSQHRMTGTGAWTSWRALMDRCLNPKCPSYPDYGGRGITICERWLSFENFYADMGDRPEGLSIDRIDNDKGYEPGNCRWATRQKQNQNRRNARMLTHDGVTLNLTEWARRLGLHASHISVRLGRGWTHSQALGLEPRPDAWEQRPVRTNSVLLTYAGETLRLSEWAVRRGLSESTLASRISLGWSVPQALGFERRR